MSEKFIILDRDNTLNEDPGYLSDPDKVMLRPHVAEALSLLSGFGYRFAVITNQSGIGRGKYSVEAMEAVNARLQAILRGFSVEIEKFYFCPHTPEDGCDCRKPGDSLLRDFIRDFNRRPVAIIGDKLSDIETGTRLEIPGILVESAATETGSAESGNQIFRAANLLQAAWFLLEKDFNQDTETKLFLGEDRTSLLQWRRKLKLSGKKLVFTNGCFDLLHPGHVQYLHQAAALGDHLIVALNSDDSVTRLKGEGRPLNNLQSRAIVMASLQSVSAVTSFPEETPIELLGLLQPDIHVKGGDYVREKLPEYSAVQNYGGKIFILPFRAGYSTTGLIRKMSVS